MPRNFLSGMLTLFILIPMVYSQDVSVNLVSTSKGPYFLNDNFRYDVTVYNNGDDLVDFYIEHLIEGPSGRSGKTVCCKSLRSGLSEVYHEEFKIDAVGKWFVTIKAISENDINLGNNQASVEFTATGGDSQFIQKSFRRNIVIGTLISILFFIILLFVYERFKDIEKYKKKKH